MNAEILSEIKSGLWDHLGELISRIEKLQKQGFSINYNKEWARWIGDNRNRWWLTDQLYFCRGEIERWKEVEIIGEKRD